MGTRNFTIDTKGSCFMCLKYNPESSESGGTSSYSLQRLSKYLQLDFKNVYNISFPMEVSVLEDSEIVVSLCDLCSTEANKFVKLHKDLELIRKRVNASVGRIEQAMVDADKDPELLKEYRQRMTSLANPIELIQASITENLRKETIEKCSKVKASPSYGLNTTSTRSVSTITLTSPTILQAPLNPNPTLPLISAVTATQSDNSGVSSTTTILPVPGSQSKKETLVVELDSSDEDNTETEPGLVIRSVSGASGTIISNMSQTYPRYENAFQPRIASQQPPVIPNNEPSASFSALQNFTAGYNFLEEFGLGDNGQKSPAAGPANTFSEDEAWRKFPDGRCECKHCGKVFDKNHQEGMTVHQRMHAGIKPITCQHCNQKFRAGSNRRIHILTYHRKELFSQFRYPAVSPANFQRSIDGVYQNGWKLESDQTDRPYVCSHCPKRYRHRLDVEAHLTNIHFNKLGQQLLEVQRQGVGAIPLNNEIVKSVDNSKISCLNCGMDFKDPVSLASHLKICTNSNPRRPLPSHSSLNNLQHFGASSPSKKPTNYVIKWRCSICSITFQSQDDLRKHKSVKHGFPATTRNTPGESAATFNCQYCGKKFKFHYSQRVHILTTHRYQVFSKYVPEGTTPEAIENAIQRILEESKTSLDCTHLCKFCKKDFTGASILENHILVNHFQEVVKQLKQTVEEVAAAFEVTPRPESFSFKSIKEENENAVEVVLPD